MCALTYQTDLSVLRDPRYLRLSLPAFVNRAWGLSWRLRSRPVLMTSIINTFMTHIMYNVKRARTEDNT